jgi:hypothetical protein
MDSFLERCHGRRSGTRVGTVILAGPGTHLRLANWTLRATKIHTTSDRLEVSTEVSDGGPGRADSYSVTESGSMELTSGQGIVAVSGVVRGAVTVLNVAGPPFTLAAVLGPAIVVPLEWESVSRHPWLTLALLVAYWLALAALRLLLDVAARRFAGMSAAVDALLGRSLSRYHHHYREWVLHRNRFPQPSRPLPTTGAVSPELDDIFVDVSVVPRPSHLVPGGVVDDAPATVAERHSIWHFLNRRRAETLILLGAPGSGKSTLLRHIARRIANRPPLPGRRWVPVLVELRTYGHLVLANPSLSLPTLVSAVLRDLPVTEPPGWWHRKLRRGRCVVLLDGLDEIPGMTDRSAILDWLRRQTTDYLGNHFVLTSRPYGYDELRMEELKTLQVRPFTEAQVQDFVRRWYRATERGETRSRRTADTRAADGAKDLINRLTTTAALHDLMVNPLLLTMIANVHRHRKSLPENRVRLYAEVFDVLLGPRDRIDPAVARLQIERAQDELASIAFIFMCQGALQLHTTTFTEQAGTLTAGKRNGVLIELDDGIFAFAHLTFQEYLTARYIRDNGRVDVLIKGINSPWWRETILLWAAGQSADDVVRACLDSGEIGALSLAFECADIDRAVSPELRERLQALVDEAYKPDATPDQRQVVAGIEALRYVRRSVPTPGGSRLCTGPVSARLYWLFLQSQDGSNLRPAPDPDRPARGMWGRDALEFVEWINRMIRDGGDPDVSYRLPTAAEMTSMAGRADDAARTLHTTAPVVWVAGRSSELPQPWTRPGLRPPTVLTGAEARDALGPGRSSPQLLLDLVSLGVRARVVMLKELVADLAVRASANHDFIAGVISHRYITYKVVASKILGQTVDRTEPVEGEHPFRHDAVIARTNLDLVEQLRGAVEEMEKVVRTRRDIGGTSSIGTIRNAAQANLALARLHHTCAEMLEKANTWTRSSLQSFSDVMAIREEADQLDGQVRTVLQIVRSATESFRKVGLAPGRPWSAAAANVDRVAGTSDAHAEPALHKLMRDVVGTPLEDARMQALAHRQPGDEMGALRSFVDVLADYAGIRDGNSYVVSIDRVRESLSRVIEDLATVPLALRPVAAVLEQAGPRAFARSRFSRADVLATRMAALALAACHPRQESYLLTAVATIMLEQRAGGRGPEMIYLASM